MFNERQLEAINTTEGRVRVVACAGSGKTTVLTERYAELVKSGVNPKNILCVTFTNKAAREMSERIIKRVGDINTSQICTFHSFCLRILRQYADLLGFPLKFNILDSDDQKAIIRKIYKECKIDTKCMSIQSAEAIITERKVVKEDSLEELSKQDDNLKIMYKDAIGNIRTNGFSIMYEDSVKDAVYYGYLYYQQQAKALDFNDLIIFTVRVFKQNKTVLDIWQKRLQYIMVDEYQDVSNRQNELVEMLSEKHGNLFVVGDPDQTIYSWRGARPDILVDFDKKKETKTIIMNQNYRSTPQILNVANKIIVKNALRVDKDIITDNPDGESVKYAHFEWGNEEGDFVVNTIKSLKEYNYEDFAVLYRKHAASRAIEASLIKAHIPYTIYSGTNFYDRMEIKDVIAYLRLINDTNDNVAFERIVNVPKRSIGDAKIDAVKETAENLSCSYWNAFSNVSYNFKGKAAKTAEDFIFLISNLKTKVDKVPLSELVNDVLEKTHYKEYIEQSLHQDKEERLENLMELMNYIRESEDKTPLQEFLDKVSLMSGEDKKAVKNSVKLMTIHSAKGLEFPVVFVVGMSDGVLPSHLAHEDEEKEEERRLAYVAFTRAKKRLYLSDSGGMDYNGCEKTTSGYIEELKDYIEEVHKAKPIVFFKPKGFKRWQF